MSEIKFGDRVKIAAENPMDEILNIYKVVDVGYSDVFRKLPLVDGEEERKFKRQIPVLTVVLDAYSSRELFNVPAEGCKKIFKEDDFIEKENQEFYDAAHRVLSGEDLKKIELYMRGCH